MGLNGFTEWLFSALLSWMQIIYNWFWSMLASGGQNEFMPWFSDNWLKIVVTLLIIGLVVDYTIYLMRWQPYHVWLTTLRRARGYVSRPFTKEQPKLHYAGYKRVLEGYDGDDDEYARRSGRGSGARNTSARSRASETYEAQPAVRLPHGAAVSETRTPDSRTEYSDAYAADRSPFARPYADDEPDAGFEADAVQNPPDAKFDDAYSVPEQSGVVDAEGYESERVTAPAPERLAPSPEQRVGNADALKDAQEEPLFSDPPTFARSQRGDMPVYGRVHQGPGQPFMPVSVSEDRRPQFELPDMELPALEEISVAPPTKAQPSGNANVKNVKPAKAADAQRSPRFEADAVQRHTDAQTRTRDTGMPRRPSEYASRRARTERYEAVPAVDANRAKQHAAASAGSARTEQYEAAPAVNANRAKQHAAASAGSARTERYEAAPAVNANRAKQHAAASAAQGARTEQYEAAPRQKPRSINVQESGRTREMDFDDELD